MDGEVRDFLQRSPYFWGLGEKVIATIEGKVFRRSLAPGRLIQIEGEPAEAIYFVASGAVKVFKTSAEGREQVLLTARPGQSFNDVPVVDGGPNPASAMALENSVIYGIGKEDIAVLLRDYPSLAINVISVLAGRLRHLVILVEDLSFRHVISRLSKLLLERAGMVQEGSNRLTQQQMASIIGTAREVVSRSLKSLEAMGAIQVERGRILILSRKKLEDLL